MMNVTIYVPSTGRGKFDWIRACRFAESQGMTVSALISEALTFYLDAQRREVPQLTLPLLPATRPAPSGPGGLPQD